MDFLIHKFSEWLGMNNIAHNSIKVKGGYIIQFIDPDEDLKKLISSLFITVDTGKEIGEQTIRTPLNIFTSSGDAIVIEEQYTGDIINTVYPVLHEYIIKKIEKQLGK